MTSYPLVFCYRDLIAGRGFIAAVETKGRLVLAEEPGEGWTLYGVNPGGIAGGAEDREAAFADFRQGYQHVLGEIAYDAEDFDAFRAAVARFVAETNDDVAAEWDALRTRVRDGELDLEMEKKDTANFIPGAEINRVESAPDAHASLPSPGLNAESTYLRAA